MPKMIYAENMDYYPYKDAEKTNWMKNISRLFVEVGMETMTEKEREVYFYRYKMGYSHEMIAKKLKISRQYSHTLLLRATKKIEWLSEKVKELKLEMGIEF